jgi:hypothetical protein
MSATRPSPHVRTQRRPLQSSLPGHLRKPSVRVSAYLNYTLSDYHETGGYRFEFTETPQPTNGTSSDLRWCDWVAISLSNDKKIPFFNPFAPVLKRDATIENAKKLLGQQ